VTVTSVAKDPVARTMTIVSELDAPVERAWLLWADPRKLERWWGPPSHPATVVEHELAPGGRVSYFVTGADGDRMTGWWRVLGVDPPRHLSFEMGDPNIPTLTIDVSLGERAGGGTRMVVEASFPSIEAMDQLLLLGFEAGLTAALTQTDAVLEGR
jgi:uncharacterized protein YndB with AHSA1/START domain